MNDEICKAIQERRLLSIYYDGQYRRVEPHVYGQSAKGSVLLRAYQVEGFSESHENYHWKLFDLSKVTHVNLLSEHFPNPRPEYNPEDPIIKEVYCQI